MKVCSGCQQEKPVAEFAKHSPGRVRSKCKPCYSIVLSETFARRYRDDPDFRARHEASGKSTYRSSPRASLRHALYHAVRRFNTDDPVTVDGLMAIWREQGGCCALSGISMTWSDGNQNHMPSPFAASLDRVDQKIGYVSGNVRLLCYCVNNFRGVMTDEQMMQVAVMLVDRYGAV